MFLRFSIFFLIAVMAAMAGCTSHKRDIKATPSKVEEAAQPQAAYQVPIPAEGSLWVDPGGTRLFGDMRARQIGDLVTIRISESPTAKLYAKTKTSRESTLEGSVAELGGFMKYLEAANGNLAGDKLLKTSYKPSFSGEGTNDRQGNMTAYVTGSVIEVLPNGNLHISGSRKIKVNNETQYINISGTIRPEDIDPNNQIQSTYIADARIEYSGKGVIAEKQMPGWGSRILDYVWPF